MGFFVVDDGLGAVGFAEGFLEVFFAEDVGDFGGGGDVVLEEFFGELLVGGWFGWRTVEGRRFGRSCIHCRGGSAV